MDLSQVLADAFTSAVRQIIREELANPQSQLGLTDSVLGERIKALEETVNKLIDNQISKVIDGQPVEPTFDDPLAQRPQYIRLIEDRLADLTTVLGTVYNLNDLQHTVEAIKAGNPDGLRLADQMEYRISKIASDAVDEHERNHDHDEYLTDASDIAECLDGSYQLKRIRNILGDVSSDGEDLTEDRVRDIAREVADEVIGEHINEFDHDEFMTSGESFTITKE